MRLLFAAFVLNAGASPGPRTVPVTDAQAQRVARFAVGALPRRYPDLAFCTEAFSLERVLGVVRRDAPSGGGGFGGGFGGGGGGGGGVVEQHYDLTLLLRSEERSALTHALNPFPLFRLVSLSALRMAQPGAPEQLQLEAMASPQRETRLMVSGHAVRAALAAARAAPAMRGRRLLAVLGAERQWLDVGDGRAVQSASSVVFLTLALRRAAAGGAAAPAGAAAAAAAAAAAGAGVVEVRTFAVSVPLGGGGGFSVGGAAAAVVVASASGTAQLAVLAGVALFPSYLPLSGGRGAAGMAAAAKAIAAGVAGERVRASQVMLVSHAPSALTSAVGLVPGKWDGAMVAVQFTVAVPCGLRAGRARAAVCAGRGAGLALRMRQNGTDFGLQSAPIEILQAAAAGPAARVVARPVASATEQLAPVRQGALAAVAAAAAAVEARTPCRRADSAQDVHSGLREPLLVLAGAVLYACAAHWSRRESKARVRGAARAAHVELTHTSTRSGTTLPGAARGVGGAGGVGGDDDERGAGAPPSSSDAQHQLLRGPGFMRTAATS